MKNRSLLKIWFGVLVAGLMSSCMGMEDTDPSSFQVPEVKSFEVKDNGSLVFELSATVDKTFAGRISECGFYYGKDKSMSGAEKVECKMLGGSFSANITLHEYGETFYACSYISNAAGGIEVCSDSKEIRVKPFEDYVEFGNLVVRAYDRASKVASVSLTYKVKDGVEVTARGLCYGSSKDLTVDDRYFDAPDLSSVSVDYDVPGIELGKTYYVRPYLYDGDELAYGEPQELHGHDVPVVEIGQVSGITFDRASIPCKVVNDNGTTIKSRGVVYVEGYNEPSLSTGKMPVSGTTGDFTVVLSELKPNQVYSVRAYAEYEVGVAYSDVTRVFTTLDAVSVDCALTYPDDKYIYVFGVVVGETKRGFLLSDENANMLYVYYGVDWDTSVLSIGDYVKVEGTIKTYHNNREMTFSKVSAISKKSVPNMTTLSLTAGNVKSFDNENHRPCKISVEGELVKDGVYYNINLLDDYIVSPCFPIIDLEQYVGKKVRFTGYYLWTSINTLNKNVVTLLLTDVSL